MDYFEDVFWFTEEILTKDLNRESGNIYNLFPNLTSIRLLKEAGADKAVLALKGMEAFAKAAKEGIITEIEAHDLIAEFQQKLFDHRAYVKEHGEDLAEITNWSWQQR